ncbi:MAG TPA: radical SAM protein [Acidobacteriota bacterium]|nr:radical SAM protein [Acidobacteriota bacterium]
MTVPTLELLESITPSRLHLIVLPTEACNFRCVYCYESFRLKRMNASVVAGIRALLRRRAPGLKHLVLSWFGGEPLLASDILMEILEEVARLRASHPALALESDVTTNASLLTRPLLERLVSLGATRYQVTFDGPRHVHDRKRIRPGGRPTFDLVWGNLAALRASTAPFRIQARLHVDRENASSIPEFLDEFRETFGDDPRFMLFIRGLSRLGGARDESLAVLEGEERRRTIEDLRSEAAKRGIPLAPVPTEPGVCYAARGNSFVIRADGRVNKCTVALERPENQVGRIRADGALQLRADLVRPWMRGFDTSDRAVLACPMKGLADTRPRAAGPEHGDAPIELAVAPGGV